MLLFPNLPPIFVGNDAALHDEPFWLNYFWIDINKIMTSDMPITFIELALNEFAYFQFKTLLKQKLTADTNI